MKTKQISNITLDLIYKYYQSLEKEGYIKDDIIETLLCFILVDFLLNTDINIFITNKDIRLINDFINRALANICKDDIYNMFDIPALLGQIIPKRGGFQPFRLTEHDEVRFNQRNRGAKNTEYRTDYREEL